MLTIDYCPGCLRTAIVISEEGCGFQRCPPYESATAIDLNLKINKRDEEQARYEAVLDAHFKIERVCDSRSNVQTIKGFHII